MALVTRLMKRLAYWALLEISHFPSLLTHNCVIHRQALYFDTTRGDSCAKKYIYTYSVCSMPLQQRLFKFLLHEIASHYGQET